MKRFVLFASGVVLLVVAVGNLAYQLLDFFLRPPVYTATFTIDFEANNDIAKLNRSLPSASPSFVNSTNILYPVCVSLNLSSKWGKLYLPPDTSQRFSQQETYTLLSRRVGMWNDKITNSPIEFFACADNPIEAVEIANAVAKSCEDWFRKSEQQSNVLIQKATTSKQKYLWGALVVHVLTISGVCSFVGLLLVAAGSRHRPLVREDRTPAISVNSKY